MTVEGPGRTGEAAPRRRVVLLAALVGLVGASLCPTEARGADPSLQWRTIESAHLRVHCPTTLLPLGQRVVQAGEEAWASLVPTLAWAPATPLELVVEDGTDDANGMASNLPYNRVVVYAVPPEAGGSLDDHDDWLRLLLYHELTHIVHLDQVGGVPALLNRVLGRTFLPNLVLPRWLHEGEAVWQESSLTGAGRLRSSLFKAQLRLAALAGRLPGPDWMSAAPTDWPHGNSWYLYGSSFVAYLVERYGEPALAAFNREYGGRLIPYAIDRTARSTFGEPLSVAWEQWRAALTAWAIAEEARLRQAGLVQGELLAGGGEIYARPRFAPTTAPGQPSRLLYFRSSGHRPAGLELRRAPGGAAERGQLLHQTDGEAAGVFSADGRALVFHQATVVDGLYVYNDLFRLELASGELRRLTHGQRAREPDLARDGRLAWVGAAGGRTRLVVAGPAAEDPRELPLPGVSLVASPRFSPDGRWLAVSGWRDAGGQRDLYLVDAVGDEPPQRLTADTALDLDPAWAPDGQTLYFSSDRGGIYDVFAYGLADRTVRRVTRVLGGAFAPAVSPDGRTLAFVSLAADGYELRTLALPAPAELPPVTAGHDTERHRRQRYSLLPDDARWPVTDYSPWPSLLPRAYSPSFGASSLGRSWGVLVAGQDAIVRHSYLLQAEWSLDEQTPLFSGAWSYDRFYPRLNLELSRSQQTWADGFRAADGVLRPYTEQVWRAAAQLAFPFRLYRTSHALGLSYSRTSYQAASDLSVEDPATYAPRYPATGTAAGLTLSWSMSNVQRETFSISSERGTALSFAVGLLDPALGSDWSQVTASWVAQQFVPLPWSGHHVASLRLSGGMGNGGPGARPAFAIGGPPVQDVILALVDETFVGNSGFLRGYPPGVASGDRYLLLNAEYRLPLLRVDRGLGFLPVYLHRLVFSPFLDAGAADLGRFGLADVRRGVGAELRTDVTLGYYLPATLRIGWGHGLDRDGEDQLFVLLGNPY